MTDKIAFAGCSFTAGTGFNQESPSAECKDSPKLWVNLCTKQIKLFKDLELVNVSSGGASNTEIFEQACYALSTNNLKYLFCNWTSLARYRFDIGFELYSSNVSFSGPWKHDTLGLNDVTYPTKYLHKLLTEVQTLHHPHGEILKILKYSNIIDLLAKKLNVQVFHINALCPWDENFFEPKFGKNILPSDYTKFTQHEILNSENRDNLEIFKLYKKMHEDWDKVGGVSPGWINIYNSFRSLQIDTNYDKRHPGMLSNEVYSELIVKYFDNL